MVCNNTKEPTNGFPTPINSPPPPPAEKPDEDEEKKLAAMDGLLEYLKDKLHTYANRATGAESRITTLESHIATLESSLAAANRTIAALCSSPFQSTSEAETSKNLSEAETTKTKLAEAETIIASLRRQITEFHHSAITWRDNTKKTITSAMRHIRLHQESAQKSENGRALAEKKLGVLEKMLEAELDNALTVGQAWRVRDGVRAVLKMS